MQNPFGKQLVLEIQIAPLKSLVRKTLRSDFRRRRLFQTYPIKTRLQGTMKSAMLEGWEGKGRKKRE